MKIYMLSKYLKKAAAVMSSVMIFSFAIQAVSPSLVAKADSVSTQTTASAQEQQEAQKQREAAQKPMEQEVPELPAGRIAPHPAVPLQITVRHPLRM